ncbi:DUF2207 domain-containing protein [Candidatus Saccharibacteria bacterium]|nr:DUF2207 domain-containing protein [Candidatus Saccharibacteria bacterium]
MRLAGKLGAVILGVWGLAFVLVTGDGVASAASVDNFYFSDFTADYYLTRDVEGISHLKVREMLTAEFPTYNQNKGICRKIPTTNNGGKNVTMTHLGKTDITLLRNGKPEPIYSIEKYANHFEVCTGNDDYVKGTQIYTLEYEFEKVVTDFEKYQELYWDTNGNGWYQRFDKLTARVHFADEATREAYDGKKWCYVGAYGQSGQERCAITEIEDGLQFTTTALKTSENLTFDVQFKPGSFVVPEPETDYRPVLFLVGMVIVYIVLFLLFPFRKFMAAKEKRQYYKGMFIKPEYQPSKEYGLAEMAENYIGKKEGYRTALLLKMAIEKKITLKKQEKEGLFGKTSWTIIINDLAGVEKQEELLLRILKGGDMLEAGDEFEVKSHKATPTLAGMSRRIDTTTTGQLKSDGLVESNYVAGGSYAGSAVVYAVSGVMVGGMVWAFLVLYVIGTIFETGDGQLAGSFFLIGGVISAIFVTAWMVLSGKTKIYEVHTMKGLKASRYMDGLKMYIEMAEAERMKLLQSVEGVDVSPEGIVRLYEKLLPYAAVFGLEDSWREEMEQYCRTVEIEPDYNLTMYDMIAASRLMTNTVRSSSAYSSSGSIGGGGGFSSGFSGGGGGGFSGGGGGGGGGSGR